MARRRSTIPQRISGGVNNNKSAVLNDLVVEWWFIWIIQFTRPRVITNLYAIHLRNLPIDHINVLCGDTPPPEWPHVLPSPQHKARLSSKLPLPYNIIMDHSCSTDIHFISVTPFTSQLNSYCSLNIHPLDSHSVLFRRPFKCHFHANCVPQPPPYANHLQAALSAFRLYWPANQTHPPPVNNYN